MLNEWTDRMPQSEAETVWRQTIEGEVRRRLAVKMREIKRDVLGSEDIPVGFYDAMRHFLVLREKLFPHLNPDPAWKILVALADTAPGSEKTSVTSIAYGAGVPQTTALRYIAALEVEGVVRRVRHRSDRRRVMLELTAEGRRRLDAIADRWLLRLLLIGLPVVILACSAFLA